MQSTQTCAQLNVFCNEVYRETPGYTSGQRKGILGGEVSQHRIPTEGGTVVLRCSTGPIRRLFGISNVRQYVEGTLTGRMHSVGGGKGVIPGMSGSIGPQGSSWIVTGSLPISKTGEWNFKTPFSEVILNLPKV